MNTATNGSTTRTTLLSLTLGASILVGTTSTHAGLTVFSSRSEFEAAVTPQLLCTETFDRFSEDTVLNSSPVTLSTPGTVVRAGDGLRPHFINTATSNFSPGKYGITTPPMQGNYILARAHSLPGKGGVLRFEFDQLPDHFHAVGFDFSGATGVIVADIEPIVCRVTLEDGSVIDYQTPDLDHDGQPDEDGFIGFYDPELAVTSIELLNPMPLAENEDAEELYGIDNLTVSLPDTDQDGMPDLYEETNGLDSSSDDSAADRDLDGLTNLDEFRLGLLAGTADTDGDGVADKAELSARPPSNPLWEDSDLDGLADGAEVAAGTNPAAADSDGDGIHDQWEIDHGTDPLDASSPRTLKLADFGSPTMTWQSLGVLPTFNNFQGDLDRQDATFRVSIDFEAKPAGNREIVFETGGGGVGISLCYEAGNRLVLRASSNSGSGFAKLATTLGDEVIGAGEIEVMWSYQTSTGGSPQTIALWLDGRPVAEVSEILGDDWSGSGGASFGWQSEGVAGTVVGLALEGDRFVSGTINLDIGLEFFAQTLPVIELLGNPFRSAITDLRWIDATRSVHLEWTSMGGATYAVDRSEDLSQWTEIDDGVPSGGNITSFLDSSLEELPGRLYYRVRLVE